MSNIKSKRKYTYEETHKIISGILYKICYDCSEWKPCNTNYFYKNKSSIRDGISPYCKECEKKRSMIWQFNNHDKVIASNRKRNQKPERKEANKKLDKLKNESGYCDRYRKNNPEKIKIYNKKHSAKSHKITNQEWEACKKYFNHRCAYCDLYIDDHWIKFKGNIQLGDFHKEHVKHDGENGLSNCVPSCKSCNSQKSASTLEDWYNINNLRFSEERLNKIYKWVNEDYKNYNNYI